MAAVKPGSRRGRWWAPYRQVWSVPGAAAFSSVGAVARLPQAMVGLGAVVMITALGSSYTVAGAVAGAVSLSQGLLAPQVSRLADRLGQTRVLGPQAVVNVAALCVLVAAAHRHVGALALVPLGVLVGVSLPQIGAFARARWTALLAGDRRLATALAVESLIEEAVFVIGPVLVVAATTAIAPAAGLLIAAALVAFGCAAFLAQRATEPAVLPYGRPEHRSRATAHAGLRVLIGVFLGIGALFGFVEVGVVALTRELDRPGVSGAMLALWAAGSLAAGVVYGSRTWQTPPVRRFGTGVAAMAAGTVLVAACSGSLTGTTVALAIAGAANAPTLITGNALVAAVVPAHAVTEAYTWLGVTIFAGIAMGAPLGGALIDRFGSHAALWAATAAGIVAVITAVTGRRHL
ncbi:Predicted arabinose efflux permease, MFS family [Micromonospora sediminicola]|uniref:Predicted arabinose efflux permease, MFS family n=1 Tax=Micromonospora sediminicola TaxID=946078 RepID=A0A1A9B9P2_9ACTN|nr:MFS transporter [Micromonospora sediminicola]SBT65791.1 Predicted arabinose efflux permease, MFS family [Micromonospora sediminicola]